MTHFLHFVGSGSDVAAPGRPEAEDPEDVDEEEEDQGDRSPASKKRKGNFTIHKFCYTIVESFCFHIVIFQFSQNIQFLVFQSCLVVLIPALGLLIWEARDCQVCRVM